ncbi:MAG: NAD(P)H-dependent oxidoreductase subunit E [Ignavibacteriales bacterium]|nr:NAD(P)H-dependent oxidoreductase subunit E [Ignavibacteriales bacterium]
MLSQENLKKFERLQKFYPTKKALTLPVLWMIQEQEGWISGKAMKFVAELLDVPVGEVYGVVTFYTMYNQQPRGKYHLQICTNVSCQLRGANNLVAQACKKLCVKLNENTKDGRFTISEVECLGSCGTAPMMQMNNDFVENLTQERLGELLEELK